MRSSGAGRAPAEPSAEKWKSSAFSMSWRSLTVCPHFELIVMTRGNLALSRRKDAVCVFPDHSYYFRRLFA